MKVISIQGQKYVPVQVTECDSCDGCAFQNDILRCFESLDVCDCGEDYIWVTMKKDQDEL